MYKQMVGTCLVVIAALTLVACANADVDEREGEGQGETKSGETKTRPESDEPAATESQSSAYTLCCPGTVCMGQMGYPKCAGIPGVCSCACFCR